MEEKIDNNLVESTTVDTQQEDEVKKKIDWMEWIIQDLMYRLSKLETENQVLKDALQYRVDDRIQDIENKCYDIDAKLSDYNKYVLEMTNEYVTRYTHMTLSTE